MLKINLVKEKQIYSRNNLTHKTIYRHNHLVVNNSLKLIKNCFKKGIMELSFSKLNLKRKKSIINRKTMLIK